MKSRRFKLVSSLTLTWLGFCFTVGLADAQGNAAEARLPFGSRGASASTPDLSLEERGDVYMARKMFREAIETYGKIEPMTAATLNRIGVAYQEQCDYREARTYYERAIKTDRKYAAAINNLGTVHYMRRSYRRATKLYKRALALEPLSAAMYINLGMAWLARHNDAECQRNLQKALELDPEIFERRGGHGPLIQDRNTTERAKFDFYMARLYARQGKTGLALEYIRKALEYGFKDRKKLLEDEDFAAVRKLPEFDLLMKQPPKVL